MSLIYQASNLVNERRPGIYLGGKADAKNKDKLLARNVTHVLNLTPSKETNIQAGVPNYFETSFIYKRVPVYDASTSVSVLLEAADSICSFIATALCHGSVLVHCQRGVSRSVTAVLFYLMRREGMTLDDAMELVQRRRPEVDPIPAFLNMLRDYELQCRSQGDIASDSATKKFGNKRAAAVVGPSGPSPNRSRPRIGPSLPPPAIVGHEPRRNFEEPQASDVAAPSSVDEPHAVYRSAEDVAGEFSSEKT